MRYVVVLYSHNRSKYYMALIMQYYNIKMKEKTRIIIAESENIIVADLQATLIEAGYTVIATATTGEEAIEKVKELKPEIIILDIYLNGKIDGRTAARRIKKFSNTTIMFYSTCKDNQTIRDIQIATDEPLISPDRLFFGIDKEEKLISNVEKLISNENKKKGDVYV